MKLSQEKKILNLLSDGESHSTIEILNTCYNLDDKGIARIGARIHGLKKQGHNILGSRDSERRTVYWYRLIQEVETKPEEKRKQEQQNLLTAIQRSKRD